MTVTFYDVEQRSEEWYEIRRGMLTASTVGDLITPKTIKTASNDRTRAVVAQLAAERISGWTDPTFTSDDMFRGILHEPLARLRYAETQLPASTPVTEVGFIVRDIDGHSLGYSPDGLVGTDGLIEIKCPRAKEHVRTIAAGEAPAHYVPQCQAALLVTGRDWIDYVSFCAGLPLYVKRVTPDEQWHDAITDALHAFEAAVADITAAYELGCVGLWPTDRIIEEGIVI